MNNIIEQRIWDYLDGTCTGPERDLTQHLIETDADYRAVYEEIKIINLEILSSELEEPSMSFTRNLMEKIQAEPVPGSVRSLIDKRIIFGIGGFFLVSIAVLLGVLFYQLDWSQPGDSTMPQYRIPLMDISEYFNSTVLNVFYFADIIFGLYLLDGFLRNKFNSRNFKI